MVGSERILLDDTVVDSVRRGGGTSRVVFIVVWVKVHDILGYVC